MAEKRKLPARDRGGPAAKKRITEAAPPPSHQARRRKTATPAPVPPRPKEPDEEPLPTKVRDDGKLPTVSKPQPQALSTSEYQSYAESGVVAAALHRSKMNWLHNCPFEKYWIKPSKKKNQPQPPANNPPKDSMIRLGQCTMVIEPHYFEVMLYAVRRPQSHPPPPPPPPPPSQQQQHPPQPKQIVHVQYTAPNNTPNNAHNHPPNHHDYPPPPAQNQSQPRNNFPSNSNSPAHPIQPPAPPTPHTPHTPYAPSPAPQQHLHPQQTDHNTPSGPPTNQPTAPPQNGIPPQRAPDPNSQPVKPSQDPVIQLLATRAAANPELKALMRVVASSNANQDQLRTFQAHIDELNAIIASRNQREAHSNSPQVKTEPVPGTSPALAPFPTNGGPNGAPTPTQTRSPAPHPPQNINPCHPPPSHPPPIRSKNPQHPPPGPYGRPQYHPPAPQPPKQPDIKAVVFEFVMPAGAGQGVTGDRYLFPENMILDYFPGNTTVIASFLAITKFDPSETTNGVGKKATGGKARAKKNKIPATPAAAAAATTTTQAADIPNGTPGQAPAPQPPDPKTQDTPKPNGTKAPPESEKKNPDTTPGTPTETPTKPAVKEYYQPVTMRFHSSNPRIIEPLGRVVKSTSEVQSYMNGIMDKLERADIEYLALRLPRERRGGAKETDEGDEPARLNGRRKSVGLEKEGRGTPQAQARDERGKSIEAPSIPSVEDELKDSYDPPSCLVPLK